jgi:signal transduction histidine kinase/ligand-binding sensor domain-containing protein
MIVISLGCPSSFGQTPPSENLRLGHDSWTFKDGAPDTVFTLAQTNDGLLWLGSQTGLVRFDGVRFETFQSPFSNQLLSISVYALFAPASGGLWIGYGTGGFSFVNHGRITNYEAEPGSPTGAVWTFAQSRDGIIWAATTNGLWRFDGSRWRHIGAESEAPQGNVHHLGFDSEGTLWVLAGASYGRLDLVCLLPGAKQFKLAATHLPVFGFTFNADGVVTTEPEPDWLANSRHRSNGHAAYPVLRKDSFQTVDRNNGVWMLHQDHAVMRVPAKGRLSDAIKQVPPSNAEIYEIRPYYTDSARLVDREGNIWFGTGNGLDRFFNSPLMKQDIPLGNVGLAAGDDGAIWIAMVTRPNFYLYRVLDGKTETLLRLKGQYLCFVYRAPDKALWFGTDGGIWRLVGRDLTHIGLPPELAAQVMFLQAIAQDPHGAMWVSFGSRGLYRLADGVWTPYGGRKDLPRANVGVEFSDNLGRVWFGYEKSQLAVLDGDRIRVFGPSDGVKVGNVTAIHGRGEEIWIGGELGLQRVGNGRIQSVSAINHELLRGIVGIIETADGDLWLNGLSGIVHLPRSELSEALKNASYQLKGERFGRRAGLEELAAMTRPLQTAIEDSDGKLWFAGKRVVWIDPAHARRKVPPPPITVESFAADGMSYEPITPLTLPARTGSVQINYGATSLSDPEAIHFRYRLEELDKGWSEALVAAPVTYRNLRPGSYHFSVEASDINGAWSGAPANMAFTVLPAFYQTLWFRSLLVILFLAMLGGLYWLRLRQLARQYSVRLEERVSERTRIARELHDTLLQSFQGLLLRFQTASELFPTRPAEAKQTLDAAIEQAAEAITEGRDAVQGLRSSTVVTNDLAMAVTALGEQLAADETNPNGTIFHVDVEGTPRNLYPTLRDGVYRIAGEALRNAFRHAQARRIEVEIRYAERQLRLRIRDDGRGIDPKLLGEDEYTGHYGLPGMRERAELAGGKLAVWSELDSGTEVELSIPASKAYATSARRSWLSGKFFGKATEEKETKTT